MLTRMLQMVIQASRLRQQWTEEPIRQCRSSNTESPAVGNSGKKWKQKKNYGNNKDFWKATILVLIYLKCDQSPALTGENVLTTVGSDQSCYWIENRISVDFKGTRSFVSSSDWLWALSSSCLTVSIQDIKYLKILLAVHSATKKESNWFWLIHTLLFWTLWQTKNFLVQISFPKTNWIANLNWMSM